MSLAMMAILTLLPGMAQDNTLTEDEKKAGWKLLFDGKTTEGWKGYKKDKVSDGWKIVDGALSTKGKSGDICTVEEFGDFEFQIDWKISPGSNSGIMYRVAETHGAPYETGPEYQVLDDDKHPDGKNPLTSAGSIYAVYPPAKKTAKPVGEWNRTKIVCKGPHVEHWLNGEKVAEAEIGSEDWNTRVAKSKWAKVTSYGKETKGKIDLQDHGDAVEYKNIKILVLK
ncbi:MAG TPA: DUF1080 domain-containing protein [Planctomycetota bacterium]|nr:DUF1080 domain-containing protein [Planctomycetota bacterium]